MVKTEITRDRLSEFFTPTLNWHRNDGKIIDYAEIEIKPDEIKKLEENLDRYIGKEIYSEEEFELMNTVNSELWETVLCLVYFKSGTEELDGMCILIHTKNSECEIKIDLTKKEKATIISYAMELIEKVRN